MRGRDRLKSLSNKSARGSPDVVFSVSGVRIGCGRIVVGGFRQPELPRDQVTLWERTLGEAIAPEHPVRALNELLALPAFQDLFSEWARDYVLVEGAPPYHPSYLATLYIYGMMARVRSSRQLERACRDRIDFMWLMCGQQPKHSTIAAFATKHRQRLQQLFQEVLAVAVHAEMISLKVVSIDGTTIEADASKSSVRAQNKIQETLAQVDAKVSQLQEEWDRNESSEALLPEEVNWSSEPSQDAKKQKAKLQSSYELLQRSDANIDRRRAEAREDRPPKAINSITDPDSRVLKDKEGRRNKPSYNAQIAVDADSGLIVASHVSDQATDSGQLAPMVDAIQENTNKLPESVLADAAYNTGEDLARMSDLEVMAYMPDSGARGVKRKPDAEKAMDGIAEARPLTKEEAAHLPQRGKRIGKEAFVYDESADRYRCPAGQSLPRTKNGTKNGAKTATYGPIPECQACDLADLCFRNARKDGKGRTVSRDEFEPLRERHREHMSQSEAQKLYQRRAPSVEGKFGLIKRGYGFRRFMRRGIEGVTFEWLLLCASLNLTLLIPRLPELQKRAAAAA